MYKFKTFPLFWCSIPFTVMHVFLIVQWETNLNLTPFCADDCLPLLRIHIAFFCSISSNWTMDPKNGFEVKWPTDEQMLYPNWPIFLRLAIYDFLAVGPYSLLIDICVTYNYNLSFVSFLFNRRQRNRNSKRIKNTWCVCWLTKEETIILMNFFVLSRGLKEHEAPSILRDSTFLAVLVWL